MSAPSKRRRLSYYLSLPAIVVLVFLLAAQLVAMQRDEIVADLADRIAHRDAREATAAIRQLGAMARPPVAVLVAAAAATDRDIANEAQQTIGRMLRRSQQQVDSGRAEKAAARLLVELAETLVENRSAFAAADEPWLAGTTQRILQMANQLPPEHTPLVALHCDTILGSIQSPTTRESVANRELAEAPTPRVETPISAETIQANNRTAADLPADEANLNDPLDHLLRNDWSRPIFRTIPTAPAAADPTKSSSPLHAPDRSNPLPPAELETLHRPLAALDARTLLRRWMTATGDEASSVERELSSSRGFGKLSPPLVEKYLSERKEDRLELIDNVLADPNVNARPWLLLLIDDADADVRFAAVTLMATSTDPELVEKAWQAAIHDRDPRIAALASRLRERRTATQRR